MTGIKPHLRVFQLIEETIRTIEKEGEDSSEKAIALYILKKLKKEEKVEFNEARKNLQKLLGSNFDYKEFKKIFNEISCFLRENQEEQS